MDASVSPRDSLHQAFAGHTYSGGFLIKFEHSGDCGARQSMLCRLFLTTLSPCIISTEWCGSWAEISGFLDRVLEGFLLVVVGGAAKYFLLSAHNGDTLNLKAIELSHLSLDDNEWALHPQFDRFKGGGLSAVPEREPQTWSRNRF
ncbi:hypothetical protein NDU88_008448 [Pleurodeles waltl]|uniref:Uncharacterized protein n=1 Tax=Pleurodeles waltl TaxID=8319 RepID=A0AAV7RWW3_PLEWA|nr:hypothetical protein NDU88_008448 [Pleurodeles waltl]